MKENFAGAIVRKCRKASNSMGFLDGTVVGIFQPTKDQESMYNGQKRLNAVKFQSLIAPNGIIIHWEGPWKDL